MRGSDKALVMMLGRVDSGSDVDRQSLKSREFPKWETNVSRHLQVEPGRGFDIVVYCDFIFTLFFLAKEGSSVRRVMPSLFGELGMDMCFCTAQ